MVRTESNMTERTIRAYHQIRRTHLAAGVLTLLLAVTAQAAANAPPFRVQGSRLSFGSREDLGRFIETQKRSGLPAFKKMLRAHETPAFRSLLPLFDKTDAAKIEEYRTFRATERQALATVAPSLVPACPMMMQQVVDDDIDSDSDPLIADPFFAALLNRDREIVVGGKIYKYTDRGVFFADEGRYEELRAVVDARALLAAPRGVTALSANVRVFVPEPMRILPPDDCGGGGTGGGGPVATPRPPPTKEEVKNNLKVCVWDPNIWDHIFGPAESCHDYFESDKRIKTKVWSQNYLLFASVGIKVKSQNRFLRIWWADDINEIELGYSAVYFEYDLPKPVWPIKPFVYQYQYGDVIIDQWGRYVGPAAGGPKSIFEKFPMQDPGKRLLTIYLFEPLETILGKSAIDLTAKDVNSGIQSLVKQGFSALSSYLKKQTSGSAVLVYPNQQNTKLKFLFTNWVKTNSNDNKISETFDWNTAIIGFSTKGPSTTPIYDSPQSYKRFMAIAYGMGRRGSTWKGSRVVLDDRK